MEITKARLKQIIMEEIQNFIVAEQDEELDSTEGKEEAVEDLIDKSKGKSPKEEAEALSAAAEIAATKK